MFDLLMFIVLAADPPVPDAPAEPSVWNVMVPYLAVITLLYFVMSSPKRRDQSRRDQALKNLKMVEAARTEAIGIVSEDRKLTKYPLLKKVVEKQAKEGHFE